MATNLTLTGPSSLRWSSGGLLNWRDYLVGYTDGCFAIIRYSFTIDTPLTKLSLKFTDAPSGTIFSHYGGKDYRGDESGSDFGFYISSKDHTISDGFTKHSLGLPGMTNELSGGLKFIDKNYKEIIGELDLSKKPLPSGTYYLYIHNFTKTYGCMHWSARISSENYAAPASECAYETYTAPSTPSNFKFTTDLKDTNNVPIILSTGFTVEWEAAQDGVNNPVIGYQLFFNDNIITSLDKTTSYSYEFVEGVDYQGQTIKVSIQTIGTQDVAKYSEKITIEGRVNTRPSAPSVFKNYSGDGVYISGNIILSLDSQDLEDSQEELTYWRKVDDDWQQIGQEFSATISKETTYVFKAKDTAGEFGPETSFTVYRYPELIITKNEETSIEYNDRTDIISYTVNQDCEVETTSNSSFDFIEGENSINCVQNFGLGSEVTFTFYPLDQNGISLNCTSDSFPTKTIFTPSEPTIDSIEVFDQYDDSNIINSDIYPCFYKKVRIKIPKFDSRINTWDAYVLFGEESLLGSKIYDNDNSSSYFYIQAKFDVAEATNPETLSIKLGSKYTISLGNFNRIINFPFENLASDNMGELIYTTDNNSPNPLKVSFACDTTQLKQNYGIREIEGKWQLQILYGNNKRLVKNNLTPDTNSSPGTGTLSWGEVFTQAALEELGIPVSQYNGNKTFIVMVGVVNAYGEAIYDYCEQTYDFNKEAELTYFNFKFQDDNGELKSPNGGYNFVEGMTIRATYKIKKWQAETIVFKIQTNKNETTLFSFNDTSNNSLSGVESGEISIDFKIPKITGNSETWNLCLYNDKVNYSIGTGYNTFPVKDKVVLLTGFDYNEGEYVLKGYSLNTAAEGTLVHYLVIEENEYQLNDKKVTISINDPLNEGIQ